ncbi:DML1 [Candida margitis]|uniref:DML1 n=1 Tax=Candida margitis TaxID=1775924 RepID=UPI0022276B89|nr:DML1 [Candida margitis]KAI5969091.1 DML1 [Candida margitis]
MSSEILNLSYGQYSNNTTTHLYNFQESQVPYTKDTKLNHNLSTFLYKSVANGSGSANYYPRALLFDLRGGLGALNKYEYAEQVPHLDMPISNQQSANTQLQKNEYQISLDQGKTDGSLLNTGNTKYWTDYNKLIYNPKSVITLPSFQHEYNDLGSNYNLPAQKFDIYSTGVEEFKTIEVESVENFRYWLEKCDFLQGLQIGTSWNDSWGGFTTSMIEVVQDEFFNNKENIWIYGQVNQQSQAGNLPIMRRVSQIKSFIELYKSSSLFFPLSPDYNSSMLSDIDASSVWHTSCIPALFINSIWGINNQYIDQVNMLHMQENLLRGDEARKIVNEIKIVGEKDETALGDMMMDVDLTKVHDLLSAVVTQQSQEPEINLGISKPTENARYINKNCIVDNKDKLDGNGTRGGAEVDEVPTNVYKNPYMCQMAEIDTFPNILQNKHAKYHVEFNVHNGVKDLLKPYQTIIENLRLNLDDLIEDKGELVEDISNIISSYSSGFESDDDDYYD